MALHSHDYCSMSLQHIEASFKDCIILCAPISVQYSAQRMHGYTVQIWATVYSISGHSGVQRCLILGGGGNFFR